MEQLIKTTEALSEDQQLKNENAVLREQLFTVNKKLQSALTELTATKEENEKLHSEIERLQFEQGQRSTVSHATEASGSSQTELAWNDTLLQNEEAQDSGKNGIQEVLTAESIAATAKNALANSGWVYDQSTGTYFDYNTNLYYYPKTRLYYDYRNGCYYKYDQETQKYNFYYQHESFRQQGEKKTGSPDQEVCDKKNNVKEHSRKCIPCVRKVDEIAGCASEAVVPLTKRRKLNKSVLENQKYIVDGEHVPSGCDGVQTRSGLATKAEILQGDNKALSDSENECIRPKQTRYMICKVCLRLVTSSCNCQKAACFRKLEVGTKGKKRRNRSTEEDDTVSSDSEVDCLSLHRQRYLLCRYCRRVTSSLCCQVKESFLSEVPGKVDGKQAGGKGDAECMNCTSEETPVTSGVCKKPIQYSADLREDTGQAGAGDCTELDSETNVIPCIRAMVVSSVGVEIGTLFIVTCTGAMIGSSEHCDICIPEDGVDPNHAKISYNHEQRHYFVLDLGSQSGTRLNATGAHEPGEESSIPVPVAHKSILTVGSTMLILHMHLGYETCDDCEPGQIQALLDKPINPVRIQTRSEKEALRRSEMKNLKKKYHLHKDSYRQNAVLIGPKFTDRAAERRKTKGSDNPYEKDETPTSYETELATHNKGHQMLKKMGWNKGEGLGKSVKGITEPVVPKGTGKGKFGLGFGQS